KKMQLKKNNIYRIQVYDKAEEILEDLTILNETGLHYAPNGNMLRAEKMARAFLQGAFLGSGSINDPVKSNYHLEISCQEKELAKYIQKLMNRFYIPAKIIQRKNSYVVYVKQGDKIADFLRLCGASKALFSFEDFRMHRDILNQMTRLDNCELANEVKIINTGRKQIEYIEAIEKNRNRFNKIPEKILHAMEIRKEFPEASITELCYVMEERYEEKISKSGMKHRLTKIKEMALSLEEEKQ
ncbi:MAG: DNA-binding protein WhiA, partial [Holdemanella sp.]|nr:DNA-binding protein WhiA [Holdemanella sp.]